MGMMKKRKTREAPDAANAAEKQNLQPDTQVIEFAKRCNDEIKIKDLIYLIVTNSASLFIHYVGFFYVIYLLYDYFTKQDYWYFGCTLAFVLITSIVVTTRSFLFYNEEWINKKKNKNGKTHDPRDLLPPESSFSCNAPLQRAMKRVLGPVCTIPRYCDVIRYAYKAIQAKKRKDETEYMYFVAMIWEVAELIQLNLFHSFMKSAALLLLSFYIEERNGSDIGYVTWFFKGLSVISLSWALVSYDKKICLMEGIKRDDDENQLSGIVIDYKTNTAINCIIDTNWKAIARSISANVCFIVARFIALSFFSSVYGWIIFPACLVHLISTFVWHWRENYSFMDSLGLSFLHIFAYLYPIENESDKRKHPRFSSAMYLPICFCENVFLMILWSQSKGNGILNVGISSVFSYPWNEWDFSGPWIIQFATMISSVFLFRS